MRRHQSTRKNGKNQMRGSVRNKFPDEIYGDSALTGPVSRLDFLFRFTHKKYSIGFRVPRESAPSTFFPAQNKNRLDKRFLFCAGSGTRTHTPLRAGDFKSPMSTISSPRHEIQGRIGSYRTSTPIGYFILLHS